MSTSPNLTAEVQQAVHQGDYARAVSKQHVLIASLQAAGQDTTSAIEFLCYLEFSRGHYDQAYQIMIDRLAPLTTNHQKCLWNMATLQYMQGNHVLAKQHAKQAWQQSTALVDGDGAAILARIYAALGDSAAAQHYGEFAMLLDDQQALQSDVEIHSIPTDPPPPFQAQSPHANIIAFSLWGESDRYLQGAVRNAELRKHFYPQWVLRFYIEQGTCQAVVEQLLKLGCQVVMMPKQRLPFEGLFWRFQIINEPGIRHFLIRDADHLFTSKEHAAVNQWLSSGRYFHIMRDRPEQTDLIQAGLWGGVANILPPLQSLLTQFKSPPPNKMVDQQFLKCWVWPTIKQSVYIHDDFYRVFDAQPLPHTD